MLRLVGLDGTLIARRGRRTAIAVGLALVAAGTAAGFLSVAAHLALAERLPPVAAALVVAGVAGFVAAVAVATAIRGLGRARGEVARAVRTSVLVALAPPLATAARRHAGIVGLAAALGAGFWLARGLPSGRPSSESHAADRSRE